MKIGEVATKMNISIATLRYYERIGLIPPVPRNINGIRNYDEHFVAMIELVCELKRLGMSLEMIMKYFDLAKQGEHSAEKRKILLIDIRENLIQKIRQLQERLDFINYQIDNYDEILLPKTNNIFAN